MKIQMVDLHSQYLKIKTEVDNGIMEVISSTEFIKGKKVREFEEALASYLHVKHVISCANGTDALQVAFMALDLKSGDEVIIPAFTYVATAEVISLLGLKVVLADVCLDTFNIDVHQIERKITSKTKAIVPVHLFGQSCDMEPILALAKKYGLFVIEDNAQAIGATYTFSNGEKHLTGTMGDFGTTSFFPSKNLGCFGDGGAIFTNDDKFAEKARMICNHGQKKQYYHEIIGVNSRLDTIQAAILLAKLPHLNEYNKSRQATATYYTENLKGNSFVETPVCLNKSTHVFHQYTLKLKAGFGSNRDHFRAWLKDRGIPTMVYYPLAIHQQLAFKQQGINLHHAEKLSKQVISLPIHTEMNREQENYILENLKDYFDGFSTI